MKLVRIDRIAPGGAALDLHPRMTVVADAPPELRRRLVEVFRSFSQDSEPGHPGLLEVSGVRLTLDRATLDQLQLDPLVDPVLRFGASGPIDPVTMAETPTDVLLKRLQARERDPEHPHLVPDADYLRELNEAYHHFFFHYNATSLLVVEGSQFRPQDDDEALDDLVKQIKTMGRGTRYYVPRTGLR